MLDELAFIYPADPQSILPLIKKQISTDSPPASSKEILVTLQLRPVSAVEDGLVKSNLGRNVGTHQLMT